MVRMQRALFVLACGLVVAAAACNRGDVSSKTSDGDGAVVARVGGRPITKSYYEQRLAKMERRFVPDTLDLAGRKEFLQFIVNKELMALKAEELKYGEDPRIDNTLKVYGDNLAHNAAIDALTKDKLTATEEEIQAFYKGKERVVTVKHIVVKTKREAEDVRKQLVAGANFDSLVNIYSTVPRRDMNTGEELPLAQRAIFGEVKFGDAIIPVEEAVFSTPVNTLSQPVETGYGWHIYMPIAEKSVAVSPMDAEVRRRIETQIQMRKKRAITEAYYQEIADAHGMKIDEDAIVLVYDAFPADGDPASPPNPETEVKPVLNLSAADRARTLLEVDGKKVTIGEFSDKYDATNWFERPKRVTGMVGVKYWIRDKWFRDLQLARARKDGVYELPVVADEMKMRREQMMVNMLHQNLVGNEAPEPTEAQQAEFYEEHKKFYVDPEKRAVAIIYHAQERVVRRAYDEVKSGQDFIEVAIRYNDNATGPADVQTAPFSRDAQEFTEIAPPTFGLAKVGDYTEPLKLTQMWIMLQLTNITPERQFAMDEIKETVASDWKNQWQENKLNELLAEWKKNVKIDIDDKVLMSAVVDRTDVYVPGRPATPAETPATTPSTTPSGN